MSCCPTRPTGGPTQTPAPPAGAVGPAFAHAENVVHLPGGKARIGTSDTILPMDGEKPPRTVRLKPFAIERCAVTVDRFAAFIDETGYETDAERFGWSYVFHLFLDDPNRHAPLPGVEWWRAVDGADWRAPEGPGSDVSERGDHPVTHISHHDANAFAAWAGGRLPTEAEWEHAAQGGRTGARFPWGDAEPDDTDHLPCNIWQGRFPTKNTAADGYSGTAPAESFAPNGFGLFNMIGNTWEWTADRFRIRSLRKDARTHAHTLGPEERYVIKGGSYLCHRSYCYRYRIAARSSNTPDSTTGHAGFRLAYSL